MPVRAAFAIPLLVLTALPSFARPDPPHAGSAVAANRNEARWDDWDVQARITEGDYDGAVRAKQQAEAARAKADQQDLTARAPKHP
jgi:hypothetical protein